MLKLNCMKSATPSLCSVSAVRVSREHLPQVLSFYKIIFNTQTQDLDNIWLMSLVVALFWQQQHSCVTPRWSKTRATIGKRIEDIR